MTLGTKNNDNELDDSFAVEAENNKRKDCRGSCGLVMTNTKTDNCEFWSEDVQCKVHLEQFKKSSMSTNFLKAIEDKPLSRVHSCSVSIGRMLFVIGDQGMRTEEPSKQVMMYGPRKTADGVKKLQNLNEARSGHGCSTYQHNGYTVMIDSEKTSTSIYKRVYDVSHSEFCYR